MTCGLSVTRSMPWHCVGRDCTPLSRKNLARVPHVLGRLAGRDLGDDLLVARQRDLLPELAHHVGRLAEQIGEPICAE